MNVITVLRATVLGCECAFWGAGRQCWDANVLKGGRQCWDANGGWATV